MLLCTLCVNYILIDNNNFKYYNKFKVYSDLKIIFLLYEWNIYLSYQYAKYSEKDFSKKESAFWNWRGMDLFMGYICDPDYIQRVPVLPLGYARNVLRSIEKLMT